MSPSPPVVRPDAEALKQPGTHLAPNSLQTVLARPVPAVDASPPNDMLTLPGAAQEQAPEEEESPPLTGSHRTDPGTPNPGGLPARPVTAKALLEPRSKLGAGRPQPLTGEPAPAQGASGPRPVAKQLTPPVASGPVKDRHQARVMQGSRQGPDPGKLRADLVRGSRQTAPGTLGLATHKPTQTHPLRGGGLAAPARVRPATARATPTSQKDTQWEPTVGWEQARGTSSDPPEASMARDTTRCTTMV